MASVDLADLLHRRIPRLPDSVVVVPIPTTPAHIRERGYDHMLLIARDFSKLRKLRVETILKRNNTFVQHHANREERLIQAASAFKIEGTIDPSRVYLLLDDVVTTGATITQAAKLLRAAGAVYVWAAVTSRQPID